MDLVVVIILLAIVQFIVFGALVGLTRNKFAVHAPATEGNESWERRFRVQQNTMEQLVSFIPAIWICATYASVWAACVLGVVYLIGRTLYAVSYIKDPASRGPGMVVTFAAVVLLVLAGLGGVITSILA